MTTITPRQSLTLRAFAALAREAAKNGCSATALLDEIEASGAGQVLLRIRSGDRNGLSLLGITAPTNRAASSALLTAWAKEAEAMAATAERTTP